MHSRLGKITNIRDHEDGKHAEITVTHGKRKRQKGDSNGDKGDLISYHQHRSNIVIPKEHAAGYKIGQRVNAGIEIATEPGDDEGEGNDNVATEAQAIPGKQVTPKIGKAAQVKARSRIRAAMSKKR